MVALCRRHFYINFPDWKLSYVDRCIYIRPITGLIRIKISMRFAPTDPISNKPSLVRILTWHRTGDQPSSELMMAMLTVANTSHSGWISELARKLPWWWAHTFALCCYLDWYWIVDNETLRKRVCLCTIVLNSYVCDLFLVGASL